MSGVEMEHKHAYRVSTEYCLSRSSKLGDGVTSLHVILIFTFILPCSVIDFFLNNQPDAQIIRVYSVIKLYMFRASSLPIIRSFLLYIRNWQVSCRFLMTASMQSQDGTAVPVIKPAWNLPVPNVQQKTPDDGQRRCLKHVEFYNRINLGN